MQSRERDMKLFRRTIGYVPDVPLGTQLLIINPILAQMKYNANLQTLTDSLDRHKYIIR